METRAALGSSVAPAWLWRQRGRKVQTSHWRQGRFRCWQQPLPLHVPPNSPLSICCLQTFRSAPEDTMGKSASNWVEALASHAFCRTAMEPPTGTLPWVQSPPHNVSFCRDKGCWGYCEGLRQSAHKTRRILSLTQILDRYLLLGVSQKDPGVWAVWEPRPTFRSKGSS